MRFKVHTEYSVGTDNHSMAVIRKEYDGSRAFLQPFTYKTFPAYSAVAKEDAFCIAGEFGSDDVREFLQAMMDAAHDLGLTPTKAKDHTDELKAVRYHLEDMRTLVLKPVK